MPDNIRIVVVEDDAALQQMYKFKLEHSGYAVKAASDGLEGLRVIKEFGPALILLDLRMPVMNGDEMLEKLRQEEWGAKVRVIILTNISKDEAPMKLRFLNVDRYIVKAHHTPAQVIEIIKEVL
jgi:DNA-binding response OmpR family regulator